MNPTERAALRAAAETVLETQGCDWACAAYDKLMRGTHPAAVLALLDERERMREALKGLLSRDERNTCQHEDTHRGGFLWEICDSCGAKWADDKGGKPEWKDPQEWVEARAALTEPGA